MLTALVLLPFALWGIFALPTPWFAGVLGIVILLAAWEWAPLAGIQRTSSRWAWLALVVVAMAVIGGAVDASILPVLAVGVVWWLFTLGLLIRFNATGHPGSALIPAKGVPAGLVLLVPAWSGLVWLHSGEAGSWMVLLVLILTWAADIGAFFAGRAFGQHKLAVRISPGKTWEGVAGGAILALIAGYGMVLVVDLPGPGGQYYGLLVIMTVIFSVVGDLYESMIKRRAGVKDSGTLLPGHGGMLDRIDSLTATATLFAAGLYWHSL